MSKSEKGEIRKIQNNEEAFYTFVAQMLHCIQHDKIGSFLYGLRESCGKSKTNPVSHKALPGRNIENKANFKLGKIDVSSSLTSKYDRI